MKIKTLTTSLLAVSLWGEGKDKAKGILASVRGGGEEVVTPAGRGPAARQAPSGGVRGPVASQKAPLSSPVDAQALTPRKRGRGKSPMVNTNPCPVRSTSAVPSRR